MQKKVKLFYLLTLFAFIFTSFILVGGVNSVEFKSYATGTYTVTFDANGGSGTITAQEFQSGVPGALTLNTTITRNGYTFSGWSTTTAGAVEYADGASYPATASTTLYAVWGLTTYTISYNLNGGTVTGTNPTTYLYTDAEFSLINPTREGYTFAGWTKSDELENLMTTVTISTGSYGNREYLAYWSKTIGEGEDAVTYIYVNFNQLTVEKITGTDFDVKLITINNLSNFASYVAIDYSYYGEVGGVAGTYNIKEIGGGTSVICGDQDVDSIFLSEGIVKINAYALEENIRMTSILVSNSVTSIGEYAFYSSNIKPIFGTSPSLTTIGKHAFDSCTGINASYTIPSSVVTIDDYAFYGCTSLLSLSFGANSLLTTINQYAFATQYGSGLSSVSLPASLQYIGDYAFYFNPTLSTVAFAENSSLISIGTNAFEMSYNLSAFTLPDSVTTISNFAFYTCTKLQLFNISTSSALTSIGESAFNGCTLLSGIYIPSGIEIINKNTFYACTKLAEIVIPSSVVTIGESAFQGCSILATITFAANSFLTTIGNNAFEASAGSDITTITFPASLEHIGDFAFDNQTDLTTVTFEEGSSLISIGRYAFDNCVQLTGFTLPDSVTTISESAFNSCCNMETFTISTNSVLTTIGINAFFDCQVLSEIYIPNTVTVISDYTFYSCGELKSFTIPSNVTSIGEYAFNNCYSLRELTLPDTVTTISDYAFGNCSNLEFFNISSSSVITTIGNSAFDQCIILSEIFIPSTVTSLGVGIFLSCYKLVQITNLSSVTLTAVTDYQANLGLEYRTSLSTNFVNTLTDYDENGVRLFTVGTEIYLFSVDENKNEVTELTKLNLKNYTFTKFYESCCFLYFDNLTSITLPQTLTSLEDSGLAWQSYLVTLTCLSTTVPTYELLPGSLLDGNIYVPSASVTAYQTAWETFSAVISAIPLAVTFDANGGTGSITSQVFTSGVAQNLTSNTTITRTGYTFSGWSTTLTGSVDYADGALCTLTDEAITLYAVWTAEHYDITFNANGGTGTITAQEFETGIPETLTLNTTITRTGYMFSGWSTTTTGAVEYANGASYTIGSDDVTLYAVWTAEHNDVSFNANGGTGTITAQDFTYGVAQNLTLNTTITRTGYAFSGWSTTTTGSVEYADGASYTIGSDDVTLYAVWTAEHNDVTFNANGGTGTITAQDFTYGVAENLTLNTTITRDGCEFLGWSTTTTGSVEYADGASYTIGSDDVTLYAVWQATEYTITYNLNGGTVSGTNPTTLKVTDAEFTLINPEKDGYVFAGWLGDDLYELSTSVTILTGSYDDKEFVAYWSVTYGTGEDAVTYMLLNFDELTVAKIDGTDFDVRLTAVSNSESFNDAIIGYSYYGDVGGVLGTYNIKEIGGGTNAICGTIFGSLALFEGIEKINANALKNNGRISSIIIPNSVTSIGDYAFSHDSSVMPIFGDNPSFTIIGKHAFEYCYGLTAILIPNTVLTIDDYAFYNCPSLASVTIESNSTQTLIGSYAFSNCFALTSILIPDTVVTISDYAFNSCSGLLTVTLTESSSLTTIGEYAFETCYVLTGIYIPSTVTSIGDFAFNTCPGLLAVTFEDNSSLTSIGENAFESCSQLASFTLPDTVTTISASAFDGCSAIETFTIGTGSALTTIGNSAFDGCSMVSEILIPSTVTTIGTGILLGCTRLVQLTNLSSVELIAGTDYENNAGIEYKTSLGTGFENILTEYDEFGVRTFTVGDEIYLFSFDGNDDATSLDLKDYDFTNIYKDAFSEGSQLISLTLPGTLTSFGETGLTGCTNLENLTVRSLSAPTIVTFGTTKLSTGNIYVPSASVTSYETAGWSTYSETMSSMPDETYTVTFNANGGTGTMASQEFIYGVPEALTLNTTITRTGYTFSGWSTTSTGSVVYADGASYTINDENATLYAVWAINHYSVSFDANEGSGSITSQDFTHGVAQNLTLNTAITRNSYHFDGWSTTSTGEVEYADGASYTTTNNATLYAVWSNSYSITYSLDGGTVNGSNPTTYEYADTSFSLINPTKNGYTFTGWTGGDLVTPSTSVTIQTGSFGDRVYTANWEINQYTITFVTNGGEEVDEVEQDYNASISLPTPIKTGYTFSGWATISNGEVVFAGGASYSISDEDVTLYAVWAINQYTITFVTNGGEDVEEIEQDYNTSVSLPTPIKTGYTFEGWYLDEDLTTTAEISTMPDENVTLYADWEINHYSVSFNANEGTGSISSQDFTHGVAQNLTLNTAITRTGYTFNGWSTTSTGEVEYADEASYTATENATLYAVWEINQYTITFDTNGGNEIEDIVQGYNSAVTLPIPTRTGYTFSSWYLDEELTTLADISVMPDEDVTLYASWVKTQSNTTLYLILGIGFFVLFIALPVTIFSVKKAKRKKQKNNLR